MKAVFFVKPRNASYDFLTEGQEGFTRKTKFFTVANLQPSQVRRLRNAKTQFENAQREIESLVKAARISK